MTIPKKKSKVGAVKQNSLDLVLKNLDALDFLKSLPSESVDLIVTDPAYSGMNQHLKLGKGRIVGNYSKSVENDKWFTEFHDDPETYRMFLNEANRVLRKDRHIFIMFDSFSLITLAPIVRDIFNIKNIVTWNKVNIGMGHYFRRQTEFIIFASKGKRPLSRRNFSDLWSIKRIYRAKYPTQKPVAVFREMIDSSMHNGDVGFVVCDPFMGSGSSAIAALSKNCVFWGSDISSNSVQLTKDRIKEFQKSGVDPLE